MNAGTILEQAAILAYNENMANKEYFDTVTDYEQKIRNGFFPEWYLDMLYQSWMSDSKFDAYWFAQCHAIIASGEVYCFSIDAGDCPLADKNIDANNAIVKRIASASTKTAKFEGGFVGGTQDEDGYINIVSGKAKATNLKNGKSAYITGAFPLEVGYIPPHKTFFYLKCNERLARWPYGSTEIYILQRIAKQ